MHLKCILNGTVNRHSFLLSGWVSDSALAAFFGLPVLGADGITRFHLAGKETDKPTGTPLAPPMDFRLQHSLG